MMLAILFFDGNLTDAKISKIIKVIDLLFKYGANLDIQDDGGRTALMKATNEKFRKYNFPIIDKLIELNADWNIKDNKNEDFIANLLVNGDISKVKELQDKYPEKFEIYKLKKKSMKYNI